MKHIIFWLICVFIPCFLFVGNTKETDASIPHFFVYEGRLLDNTGSPISSPHTFRFSLWASGDWITSDNNPDGTINTLAPNYSGWNETQTLTPGTNGTFSIPLGAISPLPEMDYNIHKHLQIEIKPLGTPDTSFELMDPTGDFGADTNDRKIIGSLPYSTVSKYAEKSNNEIFILDFDDTIETTGTGSIVLQFGKTLGKFLEYDFDNSYFNFNDKLKISNDLIVSGKITTGSSSFTITDASGNIDGAFLLNDSVNDSALNFGHLAGQISALDIPSIDNFTHSDATNIQEVMEDLDSAISGFDVSNLSGTKQNTFTLDADNTGGDIVLQFGETLGKKIYWDALNLKFSINGDLDFLGNQILSATIDGNQNTLTNIDWASIKARNKSLSLLTEFKDTIIWEDGSNNLATLSVDVDPTINENFYTLSSKNPALQDLSIMVGVTIPEDFIAWQPVPLQIKIRSATTNPADNQLDLFLWDTSKNPVTLSGGTDIVSTIANTWEVKNITFTGTPTWTQGQTIQLEVKLQAKSSNKIDISQIKINYIGK